MPETSKGWVIVGTSVPISISSLPQRLTPVYADPDDSGRVIIPLGDEEPSSPAGWGVESQAWFDARVAAGEGSRLSPHLAFKPSHVLIKFKPTEAPEYFPKKKLSRKLAEATDEGLNKLASALRDGDTKDASYWLDYALRANSGNPPHLRLLTLAIKRKDFSRARIERTESFFSEYGDKEIIRQGLEQWQKDHRLEPLLATIGQDSMGRRFWPPQHQGCVSMTKPSYLDPYISNFKLPEWRHTHLQYQ